MKRTSVPSESEDPFGKDFDVLNSADGYHTIRLKSYLEFPALLTKTHFLNRPEFIYRGHSDSTWQLLPTLYRNAAERILKAGDTPKQLEEKNLIGIAALSILREFLYTISSTPHLSDRHRALLSTLRGLPNKHIRSLDDLMHFQADLQHTVEELWALGQHHGLYTPLLDWTIAPLTALYFAFNDENPKEADRETRVVFALNTKLIRERCEHPDFPLPKVTFVSPLTQANYRLQRQHGLFTYSYDYVPLEDWVTTTFAGSREAVLIRIEIANSQQKECLRWLNRMGVNPKTLFPDLQGFAEFCNKKHSDAQY